MKRLLTLFSILICFNAGAQDSLKVMHYNLLNYGNFTDYCTLANNNPASKAGWLKTIIDYYLPDVFAVNEISPNSYYHQQILDAIMNSSGRSNYLKSTATNNAGSDIINLLYYNSDKLGLASQDVILTSVRDINVYKLYYRQSAIQDTIFFYCISAHLKAGTTTTDKTQRGEMALLAMNYLSSKNITAPCLIMGDFNLQNSSEPAWINLTNYAVSTYNFSDPAGMVGSWHANAAFASVHTQSTHIISNGCAAAGGIDDRFDFILTNQAITNPSSKVKYISGSFTIPGQDGLRFNGSVLDPPNVSAPANVLDALYQMSDHLPVIIKLQVEASPVNNQPCSELFFSEYVEGTGNNKALEIYNPSDFPVNLSNYRLARYANGATTPDFIGLAGVLAPKKTYVVVLDKRDPSGTGSELPVDTALMAVADTFLCADYTINQTMYFNGNDAMSLQKTNGQIVDLIGKIGENPGVGWTADSLCSLGHFTDKCGAIGWTVNHTLVRKSQVQSGLSNNPSAFNVTLEWDSLPVNTFVRLGNHQSNCATELPANWNFVQAMVSHIVTIPLAILPELNGEPIKPGDYIGAFYLNGTTEHCAGYSRWTGNSNIAVVAYGDDYLTQQKDGFEENENLIWKVFSFAAYQEFYADVDYNLTFPISNGKFKSFGFSAITRFEAFTLNEQTVNLEIGWSGISSYLNPKWKEIEKFLGTNSSSVIYLSDGTLIYYPAGNLHSLIDWDSKNGYFIKTAAPVQFLIQGIPQNSTTVNLIEGWNLLPILSNCPVDVIDVKNVLASQLIQIKEVAGVMVFWPEKEISTLQILTPGKSYFIKVSQNCTLNFESCE